MNLWDLQVDVAMRLAGACEGKFELGPDKTIASPGDRRALDIYQDEDRNGEPCVYVLIMSPDIDELNEFCHEAHDQLSKVQGIVYYIERTMMEAIDDETWLAVRVRLEEVDPKAPKLQQLKVAFNGRLNQTLTIENFGPVQTSNAVI